MSSIDTAVFWIEYVIRNGPNALRSPALNLHWWQQALLDVYGFIILSFIFILFLIHYSTTSLFKKYRSILPRKVKKEKGKKA